MQRIMLIEDNPEDRETTLRAFRKSGVSNPVIQCEDGDQALDYMFRRGQYTEAEKSPRPSMIILDINMPGTDGIDVLVELKADAELKHIPVIVLTTSNDESDIYECYKAGANSYVQKPLNWDAFLSAIKRLRDYWLDSET